MLAHLIGDCYAKIKSERRKAESGNALAQAVSEALREVIGTYGLAVISTEFPGTIIGARRGSPLIIGIGKAEHFLASDASSLMTGSIVLADGGYCCW